MEEFNCPITHTLMQDPVVAPDGWSYERSAIEEWIQLHGVSPVTREPLALHQLVPNISLRKAIEQYKKDHPELAAAAPAPSAATIPDAIAPAAASVAAAAPAGPVDRSMPALHVQKFEHRDDTFLHVSLELPTRPSTQRKAAFVVAMVDISGSMNISVNEQNDEESMFSRLDLVKHTLKTFVTCLGEHDLFSIIVYDDTAEVRVAPTLMTAERKEYVKQRIDELRPRNSTNIWAALERAMEVVKNANVDPERYNIGGFLLTDGQSNMDPPRGIIPTLQQRLETSPISFAINTFGYGYSIDSPLLINIANMTHGAYGFIPDASMVGTVFVNALANLLSAGAVQTEVYLSGLEGTDHQVLHYIPEESRQALSFGARLSHLLKPARRQTLVNGSLNFGARRSYLLKLGRGTDPSLVLRLDAKLDRLMLTREFSVADCPAVEPEIFFGEYARVRMLDTVAAAKTKADQSDFAGAVAELVRLQAELRAGECSDCVLVQSVIRDLDSPLDSEGQLSKAVANREWYVRWGKHYVPHFLNAHALQHCLNFKDQSQQQFGGDLFQTIQKTFEDAFISLPAPTPSLTIRANVAVPTTMANYYNYGGGCFLGHGQVQRLDPKTNSVQSALVQDVQRGDRVLISASEQKYAAVRCVVRMLTEEPMQFVNVDGLMITHWHPVLRGGKWAFPANLPDKHERVSGLPSELVADASNNTVASEDVVYDFVLEDDAERHSVVINGTEVITLGHGIQDPVAGHAYLGTQAVIDDLSKLPGWQDGLVTLRASQFLRDDSNKICGIARV